MLGYEETCSLCPRNCKVNRAKKEVGYCGVTSTFKVARAALHMWEEPCISGKSGSGAIFFSGCNMGCVFCQNHEISIGRWGKEISSERFMEICYELKDKGAHNINLVTPDHYITELCIVLDRLKKQGFDLPIVYNSSAYVKVEALRRMEGLVDIYLPDFKYDSGEVAQRYSRAKDYPVTARAAISEMVRQQPDCRFDTAGMLKHGVIVRHLLLPGQLYAARKIVKYLHETYGDRIYISLMNQYTPIEGCGQMLTSDLGDMDEELAKKVLGDTVEKLAKKVPADSYENLVRYAQSIGVEQGFIQEGETAKESFIPAFDLEGV